MRKPFEISSMPESPSSPSASSSNDEASECLRFVGLAAVSSFLPVLLPLPLPLPFFVYSFSFLKRTRCTMTASSR